MTKTTDTTWQEEARAESWVQESSAMSELPILKVYNKPMGKTAVEDVTKAGKIIVKNNGWEFEVFGDEIKLNVLLVRKFYTGFVPRIDEFWDIQKDENQNVIKDFYYTPEVDVFSKDNIAIWIQRKWGKKEVIGKAPKWDFDAYCKEPKINGSINPLFKEMKTNEQTGERYTLSYMKLGYVIYAQDTETEQIYKVIPWGSYWRFSDVQPWTFEDLKNKAKNKYKEEYNTFMLDSFINTKVTVRSDWKYYYLDWALDWFQERDNRVTVEETRVLINEFNKERFVWVDFDKPLETLWYNAPLAIWSWINVTAVEERHEAKQKAKSTSVDDSEVSISDIPFK